MDKPVIEKYSRSEKSLSTLTKKFVEMLQNEIVLDLNTATLALEVSKKRRIYDITNVLEGINLIKKAGKNMYKWKGKTDDVNSHQEVYLRVLKDDQIRLQDEEKQLNRDIKILQMNLAALSSSNSFQYLTKPDFDTAYGCEETVLIAKDYKQIKFNFECDPHESNSLLLNNQKETELRDVHILGDVLKQAQLKLVNSQVKLNSDPNLLFCFDDMASDDEKSEKEKNLSSLKKLIKKKKNYAARSQNLNLFRRRLKYVKFWDTEDDEREKLAATILDVDKFKDKSLFHFINEKQLVQLSDYTEPDFISLSPPVDTSYESNYSEEAPSVHDLFDIDIDTSKIDYEPETAQEYEMMEFLEDEDL